MNSIYNKVGILTDARSMAKRYGSKDLVEKLDLELKRERNRILLEESRKRIETSGLFEYRGYQAHPDGTGFALYNLTQSVGIHPANTTVSEQTALKILDEIRPIRANDCAVS